MKKSILVLIALLFAASVLTAAAEGALFTTQYFTVEIPEGWETDMNAQDDDPGDDTVPLGVFGDMSREIGLISEANLAYYEDLKDFSLWNSDPDQLQAYADAVMEDLKEDKPEYLGIVMAGNIPFVLLKATDAEEEYEYLWAETITNGNSIQFCAYVNDIDGEQTFPVTEEYTEQFKTILATFKPAS